MNRMAGTKVLPMWSLWDACRMGRVDRATSFILRMNEPQEIDQSVAEASVEYITPLPLELEMADEDLEEEALSAAPASYGTVLSCSSSSSDVAADRVEPRRSERCDASGACHQRFPGTCCRHHTRRVTTGRWEVHGGGESGSCIACSAMVNRLQNGGAGSDRDGDDGGAGETLVVRRQCECMLRLVSPPPTLAAGADGPAARARAEACNRCGGLRSAQSGSEAASAADRRVHQPGISLRRLSGSFSDDDDGADAGSGGADNPGSPPSPPPLPPLPPLPPPPDRAEAEGGAAGLAGGNDAGRVCGAACAACGEACCCSRRTRLFEFRPFSLSNPNPLHLAVAYNHPDVVFLLLSSGANIELFEAGFDWKTPLLIACLAGHHVVAELLLSRGADPNAVAPGHTSCLSVAAGRGDVLMAKLLLRFGASTDGQSSALLRAVRARSFAVAALLVECGTEVDFVCPVTRENVLCVALRTGQRRVCRLLLTRGANVPPRLLAALGARVPPPAPSKYMPASVLRMAAAKAAEGGATQGRGQPEAWPLLDELGHDWRPLVSLCRPSGPGAAAAGAAGGSAPRLGCTAEPLAPIPWRAKLHRHFPRPFRKRVEALLMLLQWGSVTGLSRYPEFTGGVSLPWEVVELIIRWLAFLEFWPLVCVDTPACLPAWWWEQRC